MNRLSLRNNWFEVQDCRKITDHFRGIRRIHPNFIKEKPEDVNMYPVGLANTTRISTDCVQKSPRSPVVESPRSLFPLQLIPWFRFATEEAKPSQANEWRAPTLWPVMPKNLPGHRSDSRGDPAVSYRWTRWVWEIIGGSSRLQENYRSIWRDCRVYQCLGRTGKLFSVMAAG
jgi:hypothetical protein